MKNKVWLAALPFALIGAMVGAAYATAPSDSVKIKKALGEQLDGAKEGKPGPVLDYLSRGFKYGDFEMVDRSEVAKVIRMVKPDIEVLQMDPIITGDKATIVSPVRLKADLGPFPMNTTLPQVTITFVRETGTMYGVLPTSVWRMSSVQAEDLPTY
ncbi:MAG: hypothetical protein MUC92_07255 [Fimbriimonadaceae bacterium]|jgi:hypothetical protein|nr:hypothetical protein [Fimbriimonadaceae bacterium]